MKKLTMISLILFLASCAHTYKLDTHEKLPLPCSFDIRIVKGLYVVNLDRSPTGPYESGRFAARLGVWVTTSNRAGYRTTDLRKYELGPDQDSVHLDDFNTVLGTAEEGCDAYAPVYWARH